MGSRTMMKQQIMRQMVMDEERPHKDVAINGNNNNCYKDNWSSISQNNETLPSLTTTIIGSDKNYGYYKPYVDHSSHITPNNISGNDFSFICNDYSDQIGKSDSSYLLHNMCSVNNKYNGQSFNVEHNLDANDYGIQYQNPSNKTSQMGQIQELYMGKTSFSCPNIGDKMSRSANSRRINNGNSTLNVGVTDGKVVKQKDRTKKESHNRIERKRRDFINQQIVELSSLLPSQMITESESKKNKGNILKNSVMYIQNLKNETTSLSGYTKETEMAFLLVESYRKQIQDMQQQFKSVIPKDSFCSNETVANVYNEYLLLHEQNQVYYQTNNQLSTKSYIASSLSSSENGSAFKVEPSSVPSSIDNNSLSTTYRIDEETCSEFNSLNDVLSPKMAQQTINSKFSSLPSVHNDAFYNSDNHYPELGRHIFESMEC